MSDCKRDRPCTRCTGKTKSGNQCARATCKWGPYCFQHSPVEIKKAPGKGEGLFAKKDIKAGTILADYRQGEPLTEAQFKKKYPDPKKPPTHVAKIQETYYDGISGCTVAAKANNGGSANNSKINNNGKLVTTKNVPKGKEVQTSYGGTFRFKKSKGEKLVFANYKGTRRAVKTPT